LLTCGLTVEKRNAIGADAPFALFFPVACPCWLGCAWLPFLLAARSGWLPPPSLASVTRLIMSFIVSWQDDILDPHRANFQTQRSRLLADLLLELLSGVILAGQATIEFATADHG
jgi:hypothetical protein